ncbi:S-layer homology domain-containing protein [Paenibacillus whitsoniae]|uniref:Protease complex subunit PrcB family protein n=1 Tax=Paenibacillus whitsoniae TaxID=2496558 RepID=A0A3S0BGD8_9BACL|nr:S-layer homology domain-containing protein [Paenibacillus whitsoniae]RTE01386.1 protease complex subunit PrcB family protein [Paenibacillus whitsoniae]
MKKMMAMAMTVLLASSLTLSSAYAFSDLDEGQQEAIMSLKERGIVSGFDNEHFVPRGKISYAQSVQMIVKGLGLNLDHIQFFKKPLASDSFTNVPDDAWYADAFIIANFNNMSIPRDVNPNGTITREQFANLLVSALESKGDFPMVKMFVIIKDEDQITPELQGTIQRLLLYKIAALDGEGNFNPKAELTRGEAATWLYNAIKVLEAHSHAETPQTENVSVSVEKVTDDVNKVTLSRGSKPTGGYAIDIQSITFKDRGHAVVTYVLRNPAPGEMVTQMVTEPKAVTYVASGYEVTAEPAVK